LYVYIKSHPRVGKKGRVFFVDSFNSKIEIPSNKISHFTQRPGLVSQSSTKAEGQRVAFKCHQFAGTSKINPEAWMMELILNNYDTF